MKQRYPLISSVWEQNRTRIVVTIILLISVIVVFLGQKLVFEPKLLALRTEQLQVQQEVRQRQIDFANSGVPVSSTERIEENLYRFNQLIPAQADFSNFVGELFDWAERAGLEIHQVSYHPKYEKEMSWLHYGLSFSVKGSYPQIKKFINLLENAKRILLVEKITLAGSSSDKKDQQNVELRIEMTTYFQGRKT